MTARLYSTYEMSLTDDYFEEDEAGRLALKNMVDKNGDDDGELFPAAAYEPIALRKL